VCRTFRYTTDGARLGSPDLELVEHERSYCVRPDDKSDNALEFVSSAYQAKRA